MRIFNVDNSNLVTAGGVQDVLDLTESDYVLNISAHPSHVVLSSGRSAAGPLLIFFFLRKRVSHIAQLPVILASGMAQWSEVK